MNNPFYGEKYPPKEERVKIAYNQATKLQEILVGSRLVYCFRSEDEYRDFSLNVHSMELPLAKKYTPE